MNQISPRHVPIVGGYGSTVVQRQPVGPDVSGRLKVSRSTSPIDSRVVEQLVGDQQLPPRGLHPVRAASHEGQPPRDTYGVQTGVGPDAYVHLVSGLGNVLQAVGSMVSDMRTRPRRKPSVKSATSADIRIIRSPSDPIRN